MKRNRRRFLQASGCSLMGNATLVNTLLNLNLATASAAEDHYTDYKALVCILLSGGNDSWNMLIPSEPEEYLEYANARENLAVELSGSNPALPLTAAGTRRNFSVHPSCNNIRDLYNRGALSFVSNVGTLIEPTTIKAFNSNRAKKPRSLFSHLDQRQQWQTSFPQTHSRSGWLGRAAERLHESAVKVSRIPMNISLAGNNLLQTGTSYLSPYNIGPNGSLPINVPWVASLFEQNASSNPESGLFSQQYAALKKSGIDLEQYFSTAYKDTSLKTEFPQSRLAKDLRSVARTIAARSDLNHQRQTFFVTLDGWDHHNDLLTGHKNKLQTLDQALGAFQASLTELGISDRVTTFTISDFGRALVSNGDGTDHGWGGNCLVMGGSINGGKILGSYPTTLRPRSGQDVGRNGRLLPTTSCDEYFYELLAWFGVKASDYEYVLPNLSNFLNPHRDPGVLGLYS